MDLDFLFSWLKHRIRSYLGLRVLPPDVSARAASVPDSRTKETGGSPDVPAQSHHSRAGNEDATRTEAPRDEPEHRDEGDRPRDDISRKDLGKLYAKAIQRLVEDAHERECPEVIADVLAWSLARLAVCGAAPMAIPESYRLLSVHMSGMLERRKAEEEALREAEEERVLH